MRLITNDDFIETYLRFLQRGLPFLLSKISLKSNQMTISSFGSKMQRAGWWSVPAVVRRWNEMISGHPDIDYEKFFVDNYLESQPNISMLSLDCGDGTHELDFASYPNFSRIVGVDLSKDRINIANQRAAERQLQNIKFIYNDVNILNLDIDKFDIIHFNNSLHHFKNIKKLLPSITNKYLKNDGYLLLNEYVGPNRLQLSDLQIEYTNMALSELPNKYKQRFLSKSLKNKFSGPGLIRMLISDPSEAVDSESILPTLRANYYSVYEKSYGGNLLMHLLKDIAHNGYDDNFENDTVLKKLFVIEDELMKIEDKSLMMFGIYKNVN